METPLARPDVPSDPRIVHLWRPPVHWLVPEALTPATADQAAELAESRARLWATLRAADRLLGRLDATTPPGGSDDPRPDPPVGAPFRPGAALARAFAILASGISPDASAAAMAHFADRLAAFRDADRAAAGGADLARRLAEARDDGAAGGGAADGMIDLARIARLPRTHPALRVLCPILEAPDGMMKHGFESPVLAARKAAIRHEMGHGGLDRAIGRLGLAALVLALGAERAVGRPAAERAARGSDDPIAQTLALGAALAEIAGSAPDGGADEAAAAAVLAVSEIAARRSFLSGIAVALADAAGRRAPALPDDLAARALEAIEAARDVIERRRGPSEGRNLWGEAVSFPIGLGPDTLAPGIGAGRPRQDPPADALARELVRLGQPVRPPRDVLPHERGPVRLTAAEHLRLRALEGHEIRRDGRTLREALSRIVAGHDAALSPAYAAADDGDKAALLADAARRYRVAARAALVAETPALAAETGDDLRPAFAL